MSKQISLELAKGNKHADTKTACDQEAPDRLAHHATSIEGTVGFPCDGILLVDGEPCAKEHLGSHQDLAVFIRSSCPRK